MDISVTTFVVSLLTSSVVTAVVTSVLTGRNEREKQLRERRIVLAGEYAGTAMEALARLRHFKPTTGPGHRNERLHSDDDLRRKRAEEADLAIDRLRPMRGHVWVAFPGRSSVKKWEAVGATTTSDWAERVIGDLRATKSVCDDFWSLCERDPDSRSSLESSYDEMYDQHKVKAWTAVDRFSDCAARWVAKPLIRPPFGKAPKSRAPRQYDGAPASSESE